MKNLKDEEKLEALKELLKFYNITHFEITSEHYGNSLRFGPLKRLVVYDRHVHDAVEFERLGYGVINRRSEG